MKQLKDKITELYTEFIEFEKLVKIKNEEITNLKGGIKSLAAGKDIEALKDIVLTTYVDTILYNKDLQVLYLKLINAIEIYIEFSIEPLPKEIENYYDSMKGWAPKRDFKIEKGTIVEVELGKLEKAREDFLKGDFYQNILNKIKDIENV
jgi:hypothetical protein